ncbi:MAG: TRAP transporter TatT component family protein [Treponema sp.]|jgi:predicted anti-sigma-YlaC factor YlaD|nr:TRAP transporter TatT component family protein [Treponema sp.]
MKDTCLVCAVSAAVGVWVIMSSCSLTTMAMRSSNPEFIGKQLPGILDKNERKLEKSPDDQALILETGSLYVMYANAFVQGPAETLPSYEFDRKEAEKGRARAYYLRGVEILNAGLEKKYPGFAEAYDSGDVEDMRSVVERAVKEDAAYLYWSAAGSLCAYSLDPMNFDLGMKIKTLEVMIDRAYELDPDFNNGAIDDFYVLFYASLPEGLVGDKSMIDEHFRLAVEKSGGLLAGPYVSYAQSVAKPKQDYEGFKLNLEKALAIDPNKDRDNRLVNTINQRKAQYLLDNIENYFIGYGDDEWIDEDDEWLYDEEIEFE